MTRRTFHSLTGVTSALVLAAAVAPLASAESETLTVLPNGKANEVISTTDFDLGEEYRVDISGFITQELGEDRCVHDAFYYDCATTPQIAPETGQPGLEARAVDQGHIFATPLTDYMSAPMPAYNVFTFYSVVFDKAEGRLGFQGYPQDNGPVCTNCSQGLTVTITEPPCSGGGTPTRRAAGDCYEVQFSFHIDGFPSSPKPAKLPGDLVSTELLATNTKLVSKKKKSGYKGYGTIQMTTTYLDASLQQTERSVIFALDDKEARYNAEDEETECCFLDLSAEVTQSNDPECPKGTNLRMRFGGKKGGNVGFRWFGNQFQRRGGKCLSSEGVGWDKKRFKAARLGKPKRIK